MKSLFETYLKDVSKYNLHIYKEDETVTVIKEIIKIKEAFYLMENGKRVCVLADNYSIIEYMPLNKNYVCRIHLDDKLNVIEYYFNITLENIFENHIPMFKPTKMAVVYFDGKCKLFNKEALDNLLKEKSITQKEYEKCLDVANNLINEITNKTNEIVNMNVNDLMQRSDEK